MTDPRLENSIFGEDDHLLDPEDRPGEGGGIPGDGFDDDEDRAEGPDADLDWDDAGAGPPHGQGPPRRRRWIALLVALVVVVVGGVVAVQVIRPIVHSITHPASDDYEGNGSGRATVVIKPGESGTQIAAGLEKAGVVKSAGAFRKIASESPKFGAVQPGTYQLKKQMSAKAALGMLLDPSSKTTNKVTLREGLWKSEVFAKLSKATGVPVANYRKVTPVQADLPKEAKGNFEGYLFPATYSFEPGATATVQVRNLVRHTVSELKRLGVEPADYERTLTVASIVEGEAKAKTDRPKVARVIENRVAQGMKLQMDSTVHYISQRRGKAGTSEKERASKSPYNTYVHLGLPPGPINNPGAASIKAAANPAPGKWLYFVAVNPITGETRFAETYAEQQANEKVFQKWCTAHQDQC